ncbi:MAG: hypothetical protein KC445_16875 [Anaerolineales bacterium]|nr:hypothetical protein [Anaerolineales bacterium]
MLQQQDLRNEQKDWTNLIVEPVNKSQLKLVQSAQRLNNLILPLLLRTAVAIIPGATAVLLWGVIPNEVRNLSAW